MAVLRIGKVAVWGQPITHAMRHLLYYFCILYGRGTEWRCCNVEKAFLHLKAKRGRDRSPCQLAFCQPVATPRAFKDPARSPKRSFAARLRARQLKLWSQAALFALERLCRTLQVERGNLDRCGCCPSQQSRRLPFTAAAAGNAAGNALLPLPLPPTLAGPSFCVPWQQGVS